VSFVFCDFPALLAHQLFFILNAEHLAPHFPSGINGRREATGQSDWSWIRPDWHLFSAARLGAAQLQGKSEVRGKLRTTDIVYASGDSAFSPLWTLEKVVIGVE
jgi:hypothetical protein